MRSFPLFLFVLFILSCNEEDDAMNVIFSGTVKYRDTGAHAEGVPLELLIIDKDIPFDRGNPLSRIVLTRNLQSGVNGAYAVAISKSDLPVNGAYGIRLNTASLMQVDPGAVFPCFAVGSTYGDVNAGRIKNTITVDHPTYFQVRFDKIDHTSTDRVELSICFTTYETSMEVPDTTINRRFPFSYFNKIDLHYTVIKETGEFLTNQIRDIGLVMNDTTKILVEY
jgi:hypothetical protein